MTDASTLALLSDNQAGIRHPVEDVNEVYELLDRLELRASLIEDEVQAAQQLCYQYENELDKQLKADKELAEELIKVQKVEDEQRQVNEFIKSFEGTKSVQHDGREILVKINYTRKQEEQIMEDLAQEEADIVAKTEQITGFKEYTVERLKAVKRELNEIDRAMKRGSWPSKTENTEESPKELDTQPEAEKESQPGADASSRAESEDVEMEIEIE